MLQRVVTKICLGVALTMIFLLSGCASLGHPIDPTAIEKITVNVSTREDVRALLGNPEYTTKHTSENASTEIWTYMHARAVIGSATHSTAHLVQFNAQGIVSGITSSGWLPEAGTGTATEP